MQFLPDGKELRKTPKAWICNVGVTIIGEPFYNWIGTRINERNAAVTREKGMLIQLDSGVAAAFHASSAVSRKYNLWSAPVFAFTTMLLTKYIVQNGCAVNMLKVGSKRRRTTDQVLAERQDSKMKADSLQAKLAELKAIEAQLDQRKQDLKNGMAAEAVLNDLINQGDVKQYGDGTWGSVQHNIDPEPR